MSSTLDRLNAWYLEQCNLVWEHSFGITIETMDNPGWSIKIDLTDTPLCDIPFERVAFGEDDDNYDVEGYKIGPWYQCWIKRITYVEWADTSWNAYCGPNELEKVLNLFLDWADARTKR